LLGQRVHLYGIPNGDFSVELLGDKGDELFRMCTSFADKKVKNWKKSKKSNKKVFEQF
jgi:hypothetical protein